MRLFVAIPISETLKNEIKAYQKMLARLPLRFIPPENIHVTLVFLGETPQSGLPQIEQKICRSLTSTRRGQTSLILTPHEFELGADRRKPRLIWLTMKVSQGVLIFQKELAQALQREEKRAFTAHITIARKKFDIALNPQQIPVKRLDENLSFQIKEVHLMESKLERSGAKYRIIRRFPLQHDESFRSKN